MLFAKFLVEFFWPTMFYIKYKKYKAIKREDIITH